MVPPLRRSSESKWSWCYYTTSSTNPDEKEQPTSFGLYIRKCNFIAESTLFSLLRCFFFFHSVSDPQQSHNKRQQEQTAAGRMTRVHWFTWKSTKTGRLLPLCHFSWSFHVKDVEVISSTTANVASVSINHVVKDFFRPRMKPVLLTMPWENIYTSCKEKRKKLLLAKFYWREVVYVTPSFFISIIIYLL